ncbi:MAG: DUF1343 domain-containing protein [Candidatus Neomarinimicrobiota bacterium]
MAPLLDLKDEVLYEGRIGLLCNHTAFDFERGQYIFEALAARGTLKRLFLPEHGLFAEWQDQVPLAGTKIYADLDIEAEVVSLYGGTEASLTVGREHLTDLDAVVIDLQDAGCRYFTYTTTVGLLFAALAANDAALKVYVVDRPNPAGRQVEGIPLPDAYISLLGWSGLPHRHGLTLGELCQLFKDEVGSRFEMEIIPCSGEGRELPAILPPRETWEIAPSPNMPGPLTPLVYSGQCLLEGTNLSEGRGTTRPFEIFGAPYLKRIHRQGDLPPAEGAVLRPLRFVPTHHKYAGQVCYGFQIHLTGEPYHSLAHSLRLIRFIREYSGEDFAWREGPYELGSDRPAIELLAGDSTLLNYLKGSASFRTVQEALAEGEQIWIGRAKPYLIYPEPLGRVTIKAKND